jgi:hypothetical protein
MRDIMEGFRIGLKLGTFAAIFLAIGWVIPVMLTGGF